MDLSFHTKTIVAEMIASLKYWKIDDSLIEEITNVKGKKERER